MKFKTYQTNASTEHGRVEWMIGFEEARIYSEDMNGVLKPSLFDEAESLEDIPELIDQILAEAQDGTIMDTAMTKRVVSQIKNDIDLYRKHFQ
jgi:hypothetical protein